MKLASKPIVQPPCVSCQQPLLRGHMTVWQDGKEVRKGSCYSCENGACTLYRYGFFVEGYARAAKKKLAELNGSRTEEEQPDAIG